MDHSNVNLRNRDDVKRIKQCRVVFSYKQDHEDELSLNIGDVIDILGEEEEGWWRGLLNGKEGVFPSNFVEEIVSPHPNSQKGSKENLPDIGSNNIISAPHPSKNAKILCEVKYPYKAQNEDELSLKEGDIVVLLSKSGQDAGWWKGELNGLVGVFPDNFVSIVPLVEDKSLKGDGLQKHKPYMESVAIKHSAVSSQRKSLEIQNIDKSHPSDAEASITKASPPVPSKKPSIPIKKSPSGSGGAGGIFQGLRKKIVDVVDGATGSKSVLPPKTEQNNESTENAFDDVVRRPLLSDVRATRPKAPGRRLPTSIYKEHEPGVMNGNTDHVPPAAAEVAESEPPAEPISSSPEVDATDSKPKLREWEKHKAPWLEEMKLNQAKRTSTSPGPPEHKLKLTPTDKPLEGEPSKPDPSPPLVETPKSAPPAPVISLLANRAKTPPNELDKGGAMLRSKANVPIVGRPQTIHNVNVSADGPPKPAAPLYPKMPANITTRTPSPLQKPQSDRGSTEKLDGEPVISQQRYLELVDRISKLEEIVKNQAQEHAAAIEHLKGKLQIETEMRMDLQVKLETLLVGCTTIHEL